MSRIFHDLSTQPVPRLWKVGALCQAVADALDARFNPVAVSGELSGFTRASSGHSYFTLKDDSGQLRCVMFRRAAGLLDFAPGEGDRVEVRGRLDVYGPRGDLQLVVESLRLAGQGALFEQFLQRKARLEAQGLFAPGRKRALARMPQGIALITSLEAAALHDVITALRRRAPHIPVLLIPSSVQGAQAPQALSQALMVAQTQKIMPVDTILLVRGGGSLEDLWAFNDEQLAHAIAQSTIPVVSGIGHETDFTIADFVADLRAPTPTAAAELVVRARTVEQDMLNLLAQRLGQALRRFLDIQMQRTDYARQRLGRPLHLTAQRRLFLDRQRHRLHHAVQWHQQALHQRHAQQTVGFPDLVVRQLQRQRQKLSQLELRLQLLDPRWVLRRGYAWLEDTQGRTIASVEQLHTRMQVRATLVDGKVDMCVLDLQKD